jgi:uncharacterized protein YdeI (YjbR/CyaY-like superfamily)
VAEQIIFKNRNAFRSWLRTNNSRPEGLWLIFGKNDQVKTLTAAEALEEALCFGWIDGLIKKVDESTYVKFFSPRRNKSNWSENNKKIAGKLIQSGRMCPPGLIAIENAKQDGSWNRKPRLVITPEDIERFTQMIASNPIAAANYQKMSPSVKRQFTGFYLDAKQEDTRRSRLEKIIRMIEQNRRPM